MWNCGWPLNFILYGILLQGAPYNYIIHHGEGLRRRPVRPQGQEGLCLPCLLLPRAGHAPPLELLHLGLGVLEVQVEDSGPG